MTLGLVDRGSEISTDLIATKLSDKHDILVLSAGKLSQKKYQHQQVSGPDIPPPPAPDNFFQKILFRLGLNQASREVVMFTNNSLSAIKKFNPEVIIAVNGSSQLKLIRREFPKVKTVVFGRAGIGHDDLASLHARPDLFIALTPQALTWAVKHAHSNTKTIHIPNPINIKPFQSAKPAEIDLVRPIIFTVGALTSYKNIPSVIKAVSYLKSSLLLIGSGELEDEITQDLSQLDNEFSWIKHLEPSKLPAYYRASHIFCFTPDPQEAFGRVYLEAMAAGLPIVASDDPIRRKIIGNSGYFVDPHDSVDIARGIERAVKGKRKIDYTEDLKPYNLATVVNSIEKELHALI
jgi:glycosyltransferase involved in cell wall biosynthesis